MMIIQAEGNCRLDFRNSVRNNVLFGLLCGNGFVFRI